MEESHALNPYFGTDFFSFFLQLGIRIWHWMKGELSLQNLVSDEIQMLVLIGIAISTSLVGTFLILRRMTMLANALSHTILMGIVLAFVITGNSEHGHSISIPIMLLAALFMGLLTTFLTQFLTKKARLQEDASTGLVFTTLFALGIVLVTLVTRNAHIGTEVVMGNVDALYVEDLKLVYTVTFLNILLLLGFFKEFKITTFDPQLARSFGISLGFFNYMLMTQLSISSIGAFRAVGVLMVLAFITGPPLAARFLTHSLKGMLFLACLIGCIASVIGVALARHLLSIYDLALSTGGLVVCVIFVLFLLALVWSKRSRLNHSTYKVA